MLLTEAVELMLLMQFFVKIVKVTSARLTRFQPPYSFQKCPSFFCDCVKRITLRNCLCSSSSCAEQELYRLSTLSLLITYYSSVYLSIHLFVLFLYLFKYFKQEHSCLIGGDRANNQSKKFFPIVVGQHPIHLLTLTCKIQKTLPVAVGKTGEKNQKILANSVRVAVLTTAYTYIIYS